MRLSLIIILSLFVIFLNGTTIYIEDEETFPIWNEECAFSSYSEECTMKSLQEYIYDFEFDGKINNEYLNSKTFIRFFVGFDCKVKEIEVMRSCGDEVFDIQVIKYIEKLPEFYSTGKIGGIDTEFPFIIPFRYIPSNN